MGMRCEIMSGTVTGMICDGGKVGCAMKVATGSSAALLCALTAVHDAPLRVSDGICAETPEDCIRHMAQIGNQGMAQTDKEIIHNYGAEKVKQQHMFSNKMIAGILIPVVLEQLLNSIMGTADTMMVSNIGSAAISQYRWWTLSIFL